MKILLNNRPEEFVQSSFTVTELLEIKNFTFKMLVIKINDNIIKKDQYPTTHIHDGDKVMVLHLISGG